MTGLDCGTCVGKQVGVGEILDRQLAQPSFSRAMARATQLSTASGCLRMVSGINFLLRSSDRSPQHLPRNCAGLHDFGPAVASLWHRSSGLLESVGIQHGTRRSAFLKSVP